MRTQMHKIEIERLPGRETTIRCGDRYEDHLSPDEALWAVAQFLIGHDLSLRTQAEHDAWNEKYRPRDESREPWQKLLPVTTSMGSL